jgi:hypothetical protein
MTTHADAYRMYVSARDLDAVLRALQADQSLLRPPGAWQPARHESLWTRSGRPARYDRSRLARLYGGRGARVARGPKALDGRVVESWTLISPYPDPALERLEPGTLLIVLKLP